MNNDLISRSKLKDKLKNNFSRKPEAQAIYQHLIDIVDDCPAVKTYCYFCGQTEHGKIEERPQGECRTCIHRDPEDKKCDCGGIERQGCPFPVSDDYFCKFYEKGGAE